MTWIERFLKWNTPRSMPLVQSVEEVSEATYSVKREDEPDPVDTVSILFINHMQAEIVELKAENERLRQMIYGNVNPAEGVPVNKELPRPFGGFTSRAELAKKVRLKIAKERRDKGSKEEKTG